MTDFKRRAVVSAFFALAVLSPSAPAWAVSRQEEDARPPFDAFNLEYEAFPRAAAGPGGGDSGAKIRTAAARASLNVPMPIGARTTFVHGLRYSYLHFDYSGFDPGSGPPLPTDLHVAGYSLTVLRKFSSSWLLHVRAAPEIASDFQNIDHRQVKAQGEGFLDHRMRRNLVWGLGAAYTDVRGRPEVLPVVHVLVNPGGRARGELLLPYRGRAMLTLLPGLDLGIRGRLEGDRFRIGRDGAGRNTLVWYSVATVGPTLEIETMNGMYLVFDAGKAFERTFEIRDENDDTKLVDPDPKSVFFLRGGISLRM